MIRPILLAAALMAAVPAAAETQLTVRTRADLSAPVTLAPGEGAILLAFRRPDADSAGKSGTLAFARYDRAERNLVPQPRDAKKRGDTTSYNVLARSGDRKLPLDHALFVVTAGDYVLAGASPGPGGQVFNSFCLGGPLFRVPEGAVVYVGDFTPYILVEQVDGSRVNAMAWSFHPDDARAALAGQPALAGALQDAGLANGATWGCAAVTMMAYAVPGAPTLEAADTPPGQNPAPATIPTVPAGG